MRTFLQIVLAAIACYGLWRLFLFATKVHPFATKVVAFGLIARAVMGQVFFWVSYLNLPIFRNLQLGDGYWFFGVDGRGYMDFASQALQQGLHAVVFVDKNTPSFFYVQILAVLIVLFGAVTSIALLLNCAAYLGMSAIVARWGMAGTEMTVAGKVGLLAISLTPTWILWSVQPLKDTFFVFLTILYLFTLARLYDRVFLAGGRRWIVGRALVALAVLSVVLYAISSTRWYFGLFLWSAGSLALFIMLLRSIRPFRPQAVAAAFLIIAVSSQALVAGCGPYMPPAVKRFFDPRTSLPEILSIPSAVRGELRNARSTQQAVRGATTLAAVEEPPPPPAPKQVPRVNAQSRNTPLMRKRAVLVQPPKPEAVPFRAHAVPAAGTAVVEGVGDFDGNGTADVIWRNYSTGTITISLFDTRGVTTSNAVSTVRRRATRIVAIGDVDNDGADDVVWRNYASGRAQIWLMRGTIIEQRFISETPRVTSRVDRGAADDAKRRAEALQNGTSANVPAVEPPPIVLTATSPSASPQQKPDVAGERQPLSRRAEQSRFRFPPLVVGLVAMAIPPTVFTSLGLIELSGGRGLWLFADLDTLVFDGLLVIAVVFVFKALRRRWSTSPLFWPLLVLTFGCAYGVAYASTNYGTLLRHRGMVLLCLCLIPLVATAAGHRVKEEASMAEAPVGDPAGKE